MSIKWNFPSNDNGEIIGIGEAGIETFKGSLFTSLAREICQNSLDARVNCDEPVRVEFVMNDVAQNEIPGIKDLKNSMGYCREFWKDNKKTTDFFQKAEQICSQKYIRVLRISDFNTTGLTGSNKSKLSPWQDLVKSSGVSNKNGESGGSFGIGKSAPFACSDLRTIFYNTLDIEGFEAYQGVAKLVSFQYPKKIPLLQKGEITQGKGYYGEASDNSAVRRMISFGDFSRTETGTDVYVLGFIESDSWKEEIVKAIIEGYLISILQEDLRVQVDDIMIDKLTINKLIDEYKEDIPLEYNYYQVLTDAKSKEFCEDFEGLGNVRLKILIKKDFRRKVLMSRSNGMKVFDKAHISGTIPFAGVCILKDKKINEYFREMENPQHNNWEPDRHRNKTEAQKMKKKLFSFIKEKVLEVGKCTILDEMDAVGAGEFVPDIDPVVDSEKEDKSESISNDIRKYSPLQKNKNLKLSEGIQTMEEANCYNIGDETEKGEFSPESDLLANGCEHNDNEDKREINQSGRSEEKTMADADTGDANVKKKTAMTALKLRLFMCDNEKKIYKLSFIPNDSAQKAYIEFFAAGEQGNISLEIREALSETKEPLIHSKNRIYIGNIQKGKKYIFFYSVKYNEMCSMEVMVHGYKI